MTPDSLMGIALCAFAITALGSLLLVWVAQSQWLDDPVAKPRSHVNVLEDRP